MAGLRALALDEEECLAQCRLILEHACGYSAGEQILHASDQLPPDCLQAIDSIISQRRQNIPLQYLLGYAYFGNLKFKVESGVFIPRSDTETLVNVAYEKLKGQEKAKFAEVGVGSGAITISLLNKLKSCTALGIDINAKAIAITKENAKTHHVDDRLELICADFIAALPYNLNAIISNPPYIPNWQKESLSKQIADHEPVEALYGFDQDGLSFYRTLSEVAAGHLNPGGFIAVEVGDGQSEAVCEIFARANWRAIEQHEDIHKLARVVVACR